MQCLWQSYLNLLPPWMRQTVNRLGKDKLLELRLRIGLQPQCVLTDGIVRFGQVVTSQDLVFCINAASQYSPWSAATAAQGFLTAQGGHRIGICGSAVTTEGHMTGIRTPTSLCIRVARDFPGLATGVPFHNRSILIIGSPGTGKTTLLRDLIRQIAHSPYGPVAVVDDRCELYPIVQGHHGFSTGDGVDVLSGCCKVEGIQFLLRNMSPGYIAVDEITASQDCQALLHAGWCGVKLLATAHAGTKEDLFTRPIYRPLLKYKLFDTLLILQSDKTWHMERCEI